MSVQQTPVPGKARSQRTNAGDAGPAQGRPQGWTQGFTEYLAELLNCRVCRTVALWVLLSILVVEGAILFPSYRNYERDLLLRLGHVGDAVAGTGFSEQDTLSNTKITQAARRMLRHERVVGVAVYSDSEVEPLIVGEAPALDLDRQGDAIRSSDGRRYAILANLGPSQVALDIVVNLDSSWIESELRAFVIRITGLVLLITAITVMATMAVLGRFVLRPLLHLRGRLADAALAPEHPELFTVTPRRNDELGDLFTHFNNMIRNVSSAHQEAREKLAMMVENSQSAVFAFTPDGKADYLNQAALQHCGVDKFESLRRGDLPLIKVKEDETTTLDNYLRHAPALSEPVLVRANGQRISCSLRRDKLTDAAGEVLLYYAFVLDISAQKQAQAALADSEFRFRTIFEQSANAIVLADRDEQKIVDFNAATCRVFEYERENLLGRRLSQLLGDTIETSAGGVTGPRHIGPVAGVTGAGRSIDVEASLAEIEIDGRSHYLAHVSDVTEHQQTERALREAKEQSDAASRGKSAFLAAMSHELRTPLNAIIGFASILKSEYGDAADSDSQREYAELIENSGQHLLHIVKQVMDMSQIESDALTISEELIELPDLFGQAVRNSIAEIERGPDKVEIIIPDGLPILRGDTRLLGEMLVNLLTNARKFTKDDGIITLSAELTEREELAFVVMDNGSGIPADRISSVMEPFVQAGNELARADAGIGLGLPLASKYAEFHDARLHVESGVGDGTRVTVSFPANRLIAPRAP